MNEFTEHKFHTKTGTCILNPDKLVLTREGPTGQVAQQIYGSSIHRALSVYIVLGIVAIVIGIWSLDNKQYGEGAVFCIIGLACLGNVIASRNNSTANIIDRSTVNKVVARPPHPPFTRGLFVVHFLDNGKNRKRLIMMPGSMSGGKDEFKRAMLAMQETGWYQN